MALLKRYVDPETLRRIIQSARLEDIGLGGSDVTSDVMVGPHRQASARLRARAVGCLAGVALLPAIVQAYDGTIRLRVDRLDGEQVENGMEVARFTGSLRSILAIERVALNFLCHLSGIATLTSHFVAAVVGTGVGIYDTRKTTPMLRALEKYAVACGGGCNHRMGLHDAVLIKDNHLAHLSTDQLGPALTDACNRVRSTKPQVKFIEIEVDHVDQLAAVFDSAPDRVLLDNMTPDDLRRAVAMRDSMAAGIELEASGRVNLENVRQIAETGVDLVSIGSITHSAPALDLGLDID